MRKGSEISKHIERDGAHFCYSLVYVYRSTYLQQNSEWTGRRCNIIVTKSISL